MARGRTRVVACLCFVFLGLCSAQNINCTTTQDADQTTYRISAESCVSGDTSDCEYTWVNATNHVIAHHMAESEQVLINDVNKLVTKTCLGMMILSRSCFSEKKHYQAICVITCSESAKQEEGLPSWVPIVAVVLPLVVIVVLLGVVCLLNRDRISRLFSGHAPVPNPDDNNV